MNEIKYNQQDICPNCFQLIKNEDMQDHLKKDCPKMNCHCVGRKYGCSEKEAKREDILIHQTKCNLSKLYFKKKEKINLLKQQMEDQKNVIKFYIV
jgi:hypothetical protein